MRASTYLKYNRKISLMNKDRIHYIRKLKYINIGNSKC